MAIDIIIATEEIRACSSVVEQRTVNGLVHRNEPTRYRLTVRTLRRKSHGDCCSIQHTESNPLVVGSNPTTPAINLF